MFRYEKPERSIGLYERTVCYNYVVSTPSSDMREEQIFLALRNKKKEEQ
jgi:hypothetical protein